MRMQGCALVVPSHHRRLKFWSWATEKEKRSPVWALRFRFVWKAETKRANVLKRKGTKQKNFLMLPSSPLVRKTKALTQQCNNKGYSRSKLSRLCYVICPTWLSTKNYFVLAREKLHNFCTSMCWRYFYWSGWCFMFHFCVSTVLTVERVKRNRPLCKFLYI